MKNRTILLTLLLAAAGLAGCATPGTEGGAPVDDRTGAETAGAAGRPGAEGAALGDRNRELLAKRRVHFAFDSSAIDDESRAIIEAHAAHLAANPGIKVQFEGHCDERGTREYNLALGERRAQAVERLMKVLGVSGGRAGTSTYGEEKPLAPEHNESAWRLNRRVEIIYK